MKTTVELSDSEMQEICQITGERKKGPAIRKLLGDALMLKRRAAIAQKFIDGEWGAELSGWETVQSADKWSDDRRRRRSRQ